MSGEAATDTAKPYTAEQLEAVKKSVLFECVKKWLVAFVFIRIVWFIIWFAGKLVTVAHLLWSLYNLFYMFPQLPNPLFFYT